MDKNIIIPNKKKVESIIDTLKKEGIEKLHILSDFDRTLTYAFVHGVERPSIISVLRDGKFLPHDYAKRAQALYDRYHAIGNDPEIPLEKRKKAMRTWWQTHFNLLIECGLNKETIKKAAFSKKIELRDGALDFLDFLEKHHIPLIILSSTGLGSEAISLNLKKYNRHSRNIHIISNGFNYDANGQVISIQQPIIHSLNKDETILKDFPHIHNQIKDRKNVLLLGDSISDLAMVEGFNYDNLLTIGFLNKDISTNINRYSESYDIVITHDASMDYINSLLKQLLPNT